MRRPSSPPPRSDGWHSPQAGSLGRERIWSQGSPAWELVNNISAIIGLALVTLSLTYLLQVVNAVTNERTVASQIAGLGPAPVEGVTHAAAAPRLGTLPLQLSSIAESLSSAAQAHLAFPMLQFFHSQEVNSSVAVNLARFDEIITILDHGLPNDHTPTVRAGRSAVDRFLSTLHLPSEPAPPPPPPSLTALRRRCPDVVDGPGFAAAIGPLDARRSRLHTYVREEGWDWRDVAPEGVTEGHCPAAAEGTAAIEAVDLRDGRVLHRQPGPGR